MDTPLFIIGLPASGKSTFGRALARRLNIEFIDLDFYISQRFRKSIPDIFAESGEAGFRDIERNMLHEAGEFENVIISCGGGTPCFFDNMDYMLSRGKVVLLTASRPCLIRRLMANTTQRPMFKGKTAEEADALIDTLLQSRAPFYNRAHIHFEGDNLETRSQIDSTITRFLSLHLPQ